MHGRAMSPRAGLHAPAAPSLPKPPGLFFQVRPMSDTDLKPKPILKTEPPPGKWANVYYIHPDLAKSAPPDVKLYFLDCHIGGDKYMTPFSHASREAAEEVGRHGEEIMAKICRGLGLPVSHGVWVDAVQEK